MEALGIENLGEVIGRVRVVLLMGVDVGGKDFGGQEKTSANATFGEWDQAVDSQGRGSQRGKWQSIEKEGHRTWGLSARLAATNHKGRTGERGRW